MARFWALVTAVAAIVRSQPLSLLICALCDDVVDDAVAQPAVEHNTLDALTIAGTLTIRPERQWTRPRR